jgi:hypothetical protein
MEEFPNADTITRRLKKLISTIVKGNYLTEKINFVNEESKEPTLLTVEEKNAILDYLIIYGIPINNEGKSDWQVLKSKILEECNIDNEKGLQNLEKFVHRIRAVSQQIIEANKNGTVNQVIYDPDDDGFNLNLEKAEIIFKHLNITSFLRKINQEKPKLFEQCYELIEKNDKIANLQLPIGYIPNIQDKYILI